MRWPLPLVTEFVGKFLVQRNLRLMISCTTNSNACRLWSHSVKHALTDKFASCKLPAYTNAKDTILKSSHNSQVIIVKSRSYQSVPWTSASSIVMYGTPRLHQFPPKRRVTKTTKNDSSHVFIWITVEPTLGKEVQINYF